MERIIKAQERLCTVRTHLLRADRSKLKPNQLELLKTAEQHLQFASDMLYKIERETYENRDDRSDGAGA